MPLLLRTVIGAAIALSGCSHVYDATSTDQSVPYASGYRRSATTLHVVELKGRRVLSEDRRKEFGRIDEVIVDDEGRAKQVVITLNPLLGLGSKRVAVEAERLAVFSKAPFVIATGLAATELETFQAY